MTIELQEAEIFCGIARLPREMASMEPNTYLAIEIAVDTNTGAIVDVACTSFPTLGERVVHDFLIGKQATGALEALSELIESRYHGIGKRAMVAALGNAAATYNTSFRGRVLC